MKSSAATLLEFETLQPSLVLDSKIRYLQEDFYDVVKVRKATLLFNNLMDDLSEKGITSKQIEELTLQEKNIIRLIAEGFQSKEIASKLFISKHTVQTHRKNIYKKLNDCSTTDLVKLSLII